MSLYKSEETRTEKSLKRSGSTTTPILVTISISQAEQELPQIRRTRSDKLRKSQETNMASSQLKEATKQAKPNQQKKQNRNKNKSAPTRLCDESRKNVLHHHPQKRSGPATSAQGRRLSYLKLYTSPAPIKAPYHRKAKS